MSSEILYVCEKEYKPIASPIIQSATHVHDHVEISIILTGEAHYIIEGQPFTLKSGEMVLFHPGTAHSVTLPIQNSYRDLHIGITHFNKSLIIPDQFNEAPFLIINYTEEKKRINELCKALAFESSHYKENYKLMLHALVTEVLILILRLLHTAPTPQTQHLSNLGYPDKRKIVASITNYINENYMNEISLEKFAKDMYLSQVYISKIFKEETGHSPIHFLIKKRLAKAKQLLETEHLPVKVVSSKVGYEDAYHFSKLFKKYYGYPPSHVLTLKKENNKKDASC